MLDFSVRCECGQEHSVATTQAGTSLACLCGRSIEVPRLGELRARAGLQPVAENAVEITRRLTKEGKLPTGKCCLICGATTDSIYTPVAECETESSQTRHDWASRVIVILLASPLFVLSYLFSGRGDEIVATHGRDTHVGLPLRICERCQNTSSKSSLTTWRMFLWLTIFCAVGLLFWHWEWSIGALVIAVVVASFKPDPLKSRRQIIRAAVMAIPEYKQLWADFPDAKLRLPDA